MGALFGPLVILVLFSFNDSNVLAFPLEGVTTDWYRQALSDPTLRQALGNSFAVAFVVAPALSGARERSRRSGSPGSGSGGAVRSPV